MFGRLIGLLGLSALAASALAGPQTYSQRVQNIRAGIVILDSAKTTLTSMPQSAGPHALYNLDSNTTIKPSGWTFYNPYAPTRVSQAVFDRWSAIDSNTPPVGTTISKANAPYWEVPLSQVSDEVISNYDFLLVNPRSFASLNPAEQERLRRFVDHGGVLWVDPAGLNTGTAGMDEFNAFPLPFVQQTTFPVGTEQSDYNHVLMSSLQTISATDIDYLDRSIDPAFTTSYYLQGMDFTAYGGNASLMSNISGGATSDFYRLQTVSSLNGLPVLSVGRIGEGMMIVTARGASIKLNRAHDAGTSYTLNTGFTAFAPKLDSDGLAAVKLAINMVGVLREYRQQGGSSRKTSSTAIDVNPPLIARTTVLDSGYTSSQSLATPTLYKGLLVTTVDNKIKVFDANPASDLDGDGNSDDGKVDYSNGTPYDEIWESGSLTAPLSAPVCAEVPGGGGGAPTDEVLVVDGAGILHAFYLEPKNPDGTLRASSVEVFNAIGPPNGGAQLNSSVTPYAPFAPTVHEGIAYITDNFPRGLNNLTGRVWMVDLSSGGYVSSGGAFVLGGNNSSANLPEFTYSSTVGYIPISDNSGGVDKVVYTPFAANVNAGITSAGFVSLWVGSKGEQPHGFTPTGTDTDTALHVTTRAAFNSGLPIYMGGGSLGIKLTCVDSSGNPLSALAMSQIFQGTVNQNDGPGILTFPFALGVTQLPPTVAGIRVDYTIDWGDVTPGALAKAERGRLLLPDVAGSTPTRSIQGAVALSPKGTAYVVDAPSGFNPLGGGLFGFRETANGGFTCVSRFELYDQHTITLNQATNVNSGPIFSDNDDLTRVFPVGSFPYTILNNPMQHFGLVGGPAIRNGQVIITAAAVKRGFAGPRLPVTVLMAFNAEPQTPQFNIGDFPDGSSILQPDIARSTIAGAPEVQTVLSSNNYSYDAANGVISFPNLATSPNGQIQNCLSLSQPVIIRKLGQSDYVLQPDAVGGSVWNPMQWFYVMDSLSPGGGTPLITGNSVFISGQSNLPSLFGGALGSSGVLYSVSAQIPAGQLHPLPAKPWLNQLWTVQITAAGPNPTIKGDPNILWPEISTITSWNDFGIKLGQTILGGNGPYHSSTAYGVVGGDGAVVSWGDAGLYSFTKGNFVICDEGRVIEMDASGNPIWSTDATVSAGQSNIGSAGVTKPLVRPVRAYKLTDTRYLIVDAGANRVATVNRDGVEARSITGFRMDPNITPNGFVAGEPTTLSGPRDALYYTSYVSMNSIAGLVTIGDGETATSTEYWQHYLIADTGNKRLVEVVDRFYYDPVAGQILGPVTVGNTPQVGVLLWHTPAIVSGKQYSYTSLNRVHIPDAGNGHFIYVTGIGGNLTTRGGLGLDVPSATAESDTTVGGGGVVVFDPANPLGYSVFNSVTLPDVTNTSFWDPANSAFDNVIDQSTPSGLQALVRRKQHVKHFSNLNSVTAKVVQVGTGTELAIMMTDNTGVYEAYYDPTTANPTLTLDWMMPNEVFRVMKQTNSGGVTIPAGGNSQDLRAFFARRLDSGEVLIVNGYNGYTFNNSVFQGEIIQVDGTMNAANWLLPNFGFGNASISLDLTGKVPGIGTRGILQPVFADRR